NELADEIDSKVPSGYTWGALPRGEDMMGRQSENDGKASLSISMTAIELAIQNIELEAEIIKQYMTVREFVINYPNIEYLLEEQLRTKKLARVEEVPVKPNYAMRYLQLYAKKNYQQVSFDPRSGVLSYREDPL
ncbi:MAG: hypothetical protein SVM79_04795, partial [Chloroflexota bacterium]|nr:hypothetical protein [Chloroflexota bacterium]